MKKVYKIMDKTTGKYTGSYSRACHDQFEFGSYDSALNANCHDIYHDTDKYEIHEVEVTEEVARVVPHKQEYIEKTKKRAEHNEAVEKELAKTESLGGFEEMARRSNASMAVSLKKLLEDVYRDTAKDEQ